MNICVDALNMCVCMHACLHNCVDVLHMNMFVDVLNVCVYPRIYDMCRCIECVYMHVYITVRIYEHV